MRNQLLIGDCLNYLPSVPTGSVDLVFADPPFNVGYEYDVYNDRRSAAEYVAWARQWLQECRRALTPTGSLFVAIGDEFAAEYKIALDELGLTMRNWIVWHYTFGPAQRIKFTRSHAHILYYVADPQSFTFNADAVRVPSARQLVYGDKRANSKGKVPDDTWALIPDHHPSLFAADSDTWNVPRVCGTFKERTGHPCQMPEVILDRIIRTATNPGALVLDPFAGSGTTLAAAKRAGRDFLGFELSPHYAAIAADRLAAVEDARAVASALVGCSSG